MNNFYVYELIDGRDNTVFYVGKGMIKDNYNREYRRISDHLSFHDTTNKLKNSVINKIIESGNHVSFNIVKDFLTEEEAFLLEIDLIKKYGKRIDGNGALTNLTDGGEGTSGHKHSQETKLLFSSIRKKYYETHEPYFKGKKHSEKSKELMSNSQKEYFKYRPGTKLGRKVSEETREKISKKTKGRKWPNEIRAKFASNGSKNGQAKSYQFVNPQGQIKYVIGEFKKFIKDNELSEDTCKEYINKGQIPPPINVKHNRVSQQRKNTTGWEIKRFMGKRKRYEFTPENITQLKVDEVFVYGANTKGIHGAGAAKLAIKYGAKYGEYGYNGKSYGIPTKDDNINVLPLDRIEIFVDEFLDFAARNPKLIFLVTKIGTGLSGYSCEEVSNLFIGKAIPRNVILPKEFEDCLKRDISEIYEL